MADNETREQEAQEEVAEELHNTEESTDLEAELSKLKAESRKWEARAKENKAAADELAALKAEQMTESEKLQARAEAAESELAQLKAESERTQAAAEIAAKEGVPLDLLLFCTDREHMEHFAETYKAANAAPPAAPKAMASRINRGVPEAQQDNREVFAEMLSEHMN